MSSNFTKSYSCISLIQKLKQLIQSYLPNKYSVHSINEFLEILPLNILTASQLRQIEKVFLPVSLSKNLYKHSSLPPCNIRPTIIHISLSYTKQVPFYNHYGNIPTQTEGVEMGSPLGPTLSYFHMTHVENKFFNDFNKPMFDISIIYLR